MATQKAEAKQTAAIDLEIQNRQLQLQILQLTEQARVHAAEKEALNAKVDGYKAALKKGKEKISELLKANEEFSRVNQSFEASFSYDGTPKKTGASSDSPEEQQAKRDKLSTQALRERKGTCPKVVEENTLATVAAGAVAVVGAVVAYKRFF